MNERTRLAALDPLPPHRLNTSQCPALYWVYTELQQSSNALYPATSMLEEPPRRVGIPVHFYRMPLYGAMTRTTRFVGYVLGCILHPECCEHAVRYHQHPGDTLEYADEIGRWAKHYRTEATETKAPLFFDAIRSKDGRCGGCGGSFPTENGPSWSYCDTLTIILGEIIHRPQFWICLHPKLHISIPIPTQDEEGRGKVVFCIQEEREDCTAAYLGEPGCILHLNPAMVRLFTRCEKRQMIPSLNNLCLLLIFDQQLPITGLPQPLLKLYHQLENTLCSFTNVRRGEHSPQHSWSFTWQ